MSETFVRRSRFGIRDSSRLAKFRPLAALSRRRSGSDFGFRILNHACVARHSTGIARDGAAVVYVLAVVEGGGGGGVGVRGGGAGTEFFGGGRREGF